MSKYIIKEEEGVVKIVSKIDSSTYKVVWEDGAIDRVICHPSLDKFAVEYLEAGWKVFSREKGKYIENWGYEGGEIWVIDWHPLKDRFSFNYRIPGDGGEAFKVFSRIGKKYIEVWNSRDFKDKEIGDREIYSLEWDLKLDRFTASYGNSFNVFDESIRKSFSRVDNDYKVDPVGILSAYPENPVKILRKENGWNVEIYEK